MRYPVEEFSEEEQARLRPHFTNLDQPVFALTNLPETVKGALFARYSRYSGTLRRLFLDEFADSLPQAPPSWEQDEGNRAAKLYERIFLGYGDDSVAQLGGAHIACEWTSNILTKILQRPRIGAYLEQSTRYIAYDKPMPQGGFRYYYDDSLGNEYSQAMDQIFQIYSDSIPKVVAWLSEEFPRSGDEPEAAYTRAINAKAFDLLRGLLPASSLSHMGIFASGQTYEQLILHLLAHPLPEARSYGEMMLTELKKVIPSFLTRIEIPDRGGCWIEYLKSRRSAGERWASELASTRESADEGPSVRLLAHEGSEDDLLAALIFEESGLSEADTRDAVQRLDEETKLTMLNDLVGERENRRHRPGRGYERLRYRFEIVSDYGAFRDLQRHRMLTVQWQGLTPDLGAEVPEQIDVAGVGDQFREALDISAREYTRLAQNGQQTEAPYALCLAYRMRYILDLNAREAMQLIELRSGREGHPSYRAVAQAMQDQIAEVHPAVAHSMTHVDRELEPRLERLLSEIRGEKKRAGTPA